MVQSSSRTITDVKRIEALDQFRGALVFFMIAANLLAVYRVVPAWLKHSATYGRISFIDLGAPMFLFSVGLALGLAVDRSWRAYGAGQTVRRFIVRDLVLVIFGVTGSWLTHRPIFHDWEVLQTIGVASFLALPMVFLAPRWRVITGIGYLVIFQLIGARGYWTWLQTYDMGGLGGVLGGIGWAGLILFGSSLSRLLRDDYHRFRSAALAMAITGLALAVILVRWQPLDKRLVSGSYLVLTTGLSALVCLFFAMVTRMQNFSFRPFKILGMNAMVLFMVQAVLGLVVQALIPVTSSGFTIFLGLLVLYLACYAAAAFLDHRRMIIRL